MDLAWQSVREQIDLTDEEKRILESVFYALGDGYMSDGVKLIDTAHDELSQITAVLRKKVPENIRLVSLVFSTILLGLIILLL